MSGLLREQVIAVEHWTEQLFSFRTTRSPGFRFESGQFAMIGLEVDGRPLLRAYSMASANWADELAFYSIKVPDGPLTSRLQHVRPGDEILLSRKPVGTLVLDHLYPGDTLFLLATGTGLAPFVSIIWDPETYERFQSIVLIHGCRAVAELRYGETIISKLRSDQLLGELVGGLTYQPMVTREPFRNRGRVTDVIASGDLGAFDPATARAMVCGSPAMLADCRSMLEARGFTEGSSSAPGTYVIEKAFAGE